MGYTSSLDDLSQLLGAGLDPMAGLQQLQTLKAQQAEKMAARREAQMAQQEALSSLVGGLGDFSLGQAQEGTSLNDLIPMLSAQAQFAGMDPQAALAQMGPGLESLYVTNPESRLAGMSRVGSGLPPEYETRMRQFLSSQTDAISARPLAHAALQEDYPNIYARLAPGLDQLIEEMF